MSQAEKMNAALGFYQYYIFNIHSEVHCGPMVSL